jgi:hypothetical protein
MSLQVKSNLKLETYFQSTATFTLQLDVDFSMQIRRVALEINFIIFKQIQIQELLAVSLRGAFPDNVFTLLYRPAVELLLDCYRADNNVLQVNGHVTYDLGNLMEIW